MSEPESISSRVSETDLPSLATDDLEPDAPVGRTPTEREGLPRSYRMRADAHYVEELVAQAPIVRMLAPAQVECKDLPGADHDALTKSITSLGVLQPLLVRKQGSRYVLVTGRKRLAGALAAGLKAVPCIVHDADAARAAALAEADNIRVADSGADARSAADAQAPLVRALASELTSLKTSTALLRAGRHSALSQTVGADLVEAQASRAAWLASCLQGTFENTRLTTLAAIVQRVADEFEPMTALSGVHFDCSVTAAAAAWKLPEDATTAVLTGAIYGTLSLLEGVAAPRIEVHADASHTRSLKIEVVQRAVRVHPHLGTYLSALEFVRPTEVIPALALRLARTIAAPYGGTADLTALPGSGSVLQITFANAQTA